jgi:hypothetical protein
MLTSDILNSHPVKTLKSEISKTNIKGYSKLRKNEIIELMLKNKERFNHIKKKGEEPKPPKKIKIIRKPKIEVPKITITEPEPEKRKVFSRGGRFFKPKDPKSKLPPIPKFSGKIKLPKEEPKKQDFKFDKKNITIETKKYGSITKYEIEYYDENENTYIEMTLRKGINNILFLEHLSSQFDKDEQRAKKGYTRAMLCNLINMLLNKKMVTNKTKFGLIAGDIGGITGQLEKKHNIKNLTEMYKSMGFKKVRGAAEGEQKLESNVGTVLKWCMGKYKL